MLQSPNLPGLQENNPASVFSLWCGTVYGLDSYYYELLESMHASCDKTLKINESSFPTM
jgi:hypothetical protein